MTRGCEYELSKTRFVEILNRLRDSKDLVRKVDDLFRASRYNVNCDFCNGAGGSKRAREKCMRVNIIKTG